MIEVLQEKIVVLESENANLKAEIENLRKEVIELQDKLGLNSKNSSLPPSQDVYRKKTKKKSNRNPGGQPGHEAHKRELMEADEIVKCAIDSICVCGGQVILEEDTIHQKVELPEIKPIVTEYRLQKGYSASLPEGVGWNLLRPNAEAIISSFTGFFINSKREVQQILSSIFNLNITPVAD
ncbi:MULTISPECIES: DUF6444 domain-containing protein [Wolbachia]|uniref:DUF6444 domain-containing protein n=1 Tax=Wolbachia TaxID=953 RepID=UPI0015CFCE9B|nr:MULTISPECIES: DUF6444 domain-containing protein [Wolbachia]UYC24007.1 DUF6444 domain-containing protein [Wolbachia endosymbiont of Aedes aegypti]